MADGVDVVLADGGSVALMSSGPMQRQLNFESISAVTLAIHDMVRSVGFYTSLGFEPVDRGPVLELRRRARLPQPYGSKDRAALVMVGAADPPCV